MRDLVPCGALHDLVPCAQIKKREKNPLRSVTFSKVAQSTKIWKFIHKATMGIYMTEQGIKVMFKNYKGEEYEKL